MHPLGLEFVLAQLKCSIFNGFQFNRERTNKKPTIKPTINMFYLILKVSNNQCFLYIDSCKTEVISFLLIKI